MRGIQRTVYYTSLRSRTGPNQCDRLGFHLTSDSQAGTQSTVFPYMEQGSPTQDHGKQGVEATPHLHETLQSGVTGLRTKENALSPTQSQSTRTAGSQWVGQMEAQQMTTPNSLGRLRRSQNNLPEHPQMKDKTPMGQELVFNG